jgi:DNA-binding NtrC family response regulator
VVGNEYALYDDMSINLKVGCGKKHLVLVVEDEEVLVVLMRKTLEAAGFAVLTATSPMEGIELLYKNDISLVLLDWVFDQPPAQKTIGESVLLECLKKDPWLPVVVMSGYDKIDVSSQALLNGAISFVSKPFVPDILVKHISKSIQRADAARSYFNVSCVDDILPLNEVVSLYAQLVVTVCGGNVSEAAKRLGVHRQTVKKLLDNDVVDDSEQVSPKQERRENL